jgi:hypothetical protein
MPRNITVTFADGSQHVYQGAPDDVTPDQVEARAAKEFGKKVTALDGGRQPAAQAPTDAPGMLTSLAAGAGKGMGQVALNVQKLAGKGVQMLGGGSAPTVTDLVAPGSGGNIVQRAGRWLVNDADAGLKKIEGENAPYKDAHPVMNGAGEFGGQMVATAPVGGVIAKGLSKIPGVATAIPNVLEAIGSAGMRAGNATGLVNPLVRAVGGAVNGGATAALIDPDTAASGAAVGAVMPGALQVAGKVGNFAGQKLSELTDSAAKRLMQSAIKPTLPQLRSGDAETAVKTLLDYGINPTKSGVNKLRELIDAKNADIAGRIGSSTASVDKQNVLAALADVRKTFGSQVSPTGDLNAIQGVADDFLAHPNFPGASIPVQAAQEMKQGTYRVLAKKYGQMGGAETEAQKALARGLKDEIATAVPGVGALNAEESKLLTTLSVAERRALMEMNKNPMGLAALTTNPASWAAFMADKSALFKSLAARMVNNLPTAAGAVQGAVANPAVERLAYRAAPVLAADR